MGILAIPLMLQSQSFLKSPLTLLEVTLTLQHQRDGQYPHVAKSLDTSLQNSLHFYKLQLLHLYVREFLHLHKDFLLHFYLKLPGALIGHSLLCPPDLLNYVLVWMLGGKLRHKWIVDGG